MIGVFDSGVGGLTVLRELRRAMPRADIVYFGDTKHAPYGPRPHDELVSLTVAAIALLHREGATHIVSACNSVSVTIALESLEAFSLSAGEFIEMVGPAVDLLAPTPARVLLCATAATVGSGIYQDAFRAAGKSIAAVAIPELAGAIEHGASEAELDPMIAAALADVPTDSYDTVLLGCTHYPLAVEAFRRALPPSVAIVDPAAAVAAHAVARFSDEAQGQGTMRFLLSKDSAVFRDLAGRIFPGMHQAFEVIQ